MMKLLSVLGALFLVITACSGPATTDATTGSSGVSLGATSTSGAEPPGSADGPATSSPDGGGSDGSPPIAVTPALGVSVAASDTFDPDHLIGGAGSNFVPMDNPTMVAAEDVTWMNDDTVVMGIAHSSGEAQAYPVGQMAYHHIANTTIGGEPFLVTY